MDEEPLTLNSLIPIMLKSAKGWNQVAAFVILTMLHKMELVWERQKCPISTATQHPMPDLVIPPTPCLLLATLKRKKKTIQTGQYHQLQMAANNITTVYSRGEFSRTNCTESSGKMEAEKLPAPKVFQGCGVYEVNLACVHCHTPGFTK